MREIIWGFICALSIYGLLPDVGLTKGETITLIVAVSMLSTAVIFWVQEVMEAWRSR